MDKVGIGIIGCGTTSEAYLKAAADFSRFSYIHHALPRY